MDGRDFIENSISIISGRRNEEDPVRTWPNHYIMNLPASAPEFLGLFAGLVDKHGHLALDRDKMPTIHCYLFCKSHEDPLEVTNNIRKT